jgi:transcriptional regulator with XRE-family HTH domain
MTAETGNGDPWQPMTGAEPARRVLLGNLLRLRRAALGYPAVPAFARDRHINTRMVGDIEHGRRDTYTYPRLQDVARAYDVTYDSMLAVVWSGAGELVPATPAALPAALDRLADGQDGWQPPIADPVRRAADAPYAAPILDRLLELADAGVIDPDGAQMFGEGTDDARAWDGHGAWVRAPRDRAWFIADIRRLEDGRAGNSGTGGPARNAAATPGALVKMRYERMA